MFRSPLLSSRNQYLILVLMGRTATLWVRPGHSQRPEHAAFGATLGDTRGATLCDTFGATL